MAKSHALFICQAACHLEICPRGVKLSLCPVMLPKGGGVFYSSMGGGGESPQLGITQGKGPQHSHYRRGRQPPLMGLQLHVSPAKTMLLAHTYNSYKQGRFELLLFHYQSRYGERVNHNP